MPRKIKQEKEELLAQRANLQEEPNQANARHQAEREGWLVKERELKRKVKEDARRSEEALAAKDRNIAEL